MADLTQTPANVRASSSSVIQLVQAGEAFDAGTPLYKSSTDSKYYKADANSSTAYNASAIALTGVSAADDYCVVQTSGDINIGATTTQGEVYIVSANVGKIAPIADLTTGMYPVILGPAKDTSGTLELDIKVGSVTHS